MTKGINEHTVLLTKPKLKYYVFAGEYYYPRGGWGDFEGKFASLSEAMHCAYEEVKSRGCNWAHVIDIELEEEVAEISQDYNTPIQGSVSAGIIPDLIPNIPGLLLKK